MTIKTTIVFVVILAIFIGLFFLVKSYIPATQTGGEKKEIVLFEPEIIDSAIKIERIVTVEDQQQKMIIEKGQTLWQMLEPSNLPCSSDKIQGFLDVAKGLTGRVVHTIKENSQEKIKLFGLQKPFMTLTIYSPQKMQTLTVGARYSYSPDWVYAKLANDNRIFIIPNSSYELLSKEPQYYLELRIVKKRTDVISTLTCMFKQEERFKLRYQPEQEAWYIEKPFSQKADPLKVSEYLYFIDSLVAEEISQINPAQDLNKYALEPPKLEIRMEFQNQKTVIIKFGEVEDVRKKIFAWCSDREDIVARIKIDDYNPLIKNPVDFRIRKVFVDVEPQKVSRIELMTYSRSTDCPLISKIVIGREDGKLVVKEPPELKVDSDALERFLDRLTQVNVLGFERVKPREPPQTMANIVFAQKEGDKEVNHEYFLICAKAEQKEEPVYYVKKMGEEELYRITDTDARNIAKAELHFKDKKVLVALKDPEKQMDKFAIEDSTIQCMLVNIYEKEFEITKRFKVIKDKDTWLITDRAVAHKDELICSDTRPRELASHRIGPALMYYSKIEVETFISKDPMDKNTFHLDRPYLKIDIWYKEAEKERNRSLLLTRPVGKIAYAMFEDENIIFAIDPYYVVVIEELVIE